MALLYSFAIAEAAVAKKLGVETDVLGQIESWGQSLLSLASHDWSNVTGGKAGVVEVAIYRNALAHGAVVFEPRHINRLANVPHVPAWKVGDPIVMDYELLKTCRSRLKSLMRFGEIEQPK